MKRVIITVVLVVLTLTSQASLNSSRGFIHSIDPMVEREPGEDGWYVSDVR